MPVYGHTGCFIGDAGILMGLEAGERRMIGFDEALARDLSCSRNAIIRCVVGIICVGGICVVVVHGAVVQVRALICLGDLLIRVGLEDGVRCFPGLAGVLRGGVNPNLLRLTGWSHWLYVASGDYPSTFQLLEND